MKDLLVCGARPKFAGLFYLALSSDSVFAGRRSSSPNSWWHGGQWIQELHLKLELCAHRTSPSLFWTHKDEDFGGTCALGTQERPSFERHFHFHGLARPFLHPGACTTPLCSRIFSAQSCFSFFDLHKQCSGVVTRLFGNSPLTARASKCLPISHCYH